MHLPSPYAMRLRLQTLARGERYSGGPFVVGAPSPQTTIDLIPGAWASRLPLPGVTAGQAELFADTRVDWAIDALGGVSGLRCLELGPLDGGHSYMLERAGASQIIGVEANKDAYLKCLIVKELLGLQRCRFLCGDAIGYLQETEDRFDACWCAGILYHMVEPIKLIHLISQRASRLYMWTHYYDAARLTPDQPKGKPFADGQTSEAVYEGYHYRLHRHDYRGGARLRRFWGGTQPYSNWLTLEDLLGALEHFGWGEIRTQLYEEHQNGPAVDVVAVRV